MSNYDLLNPQNPSLKPYMNISFNSAITNLLNMNNGGITNVSSINGHPITPIGVDLNPISIIWRPGGLVVPGSNVVVSWQSVISKASQININEILNVYCDSSIQNCIINQPYDCQGRLTFMPFNSNASSPDTLYLQDANTLTNPKFDGILLVELQSITQPSIILNGAQLTIDNYGAMIYASSDSTIPGISVQGTGAVLGLQGGSNLSNSNTSNPLINVGSGSVFIMSMGENFGGATLNNNLVSSTDNTATWNFLYDSSVIGVASWTNPNFTGTFNAVMSDKSEAVAYNDSLVSPPTGSNNVQGAIDYLKSHSGGVTYPLLAPAGSAAAPSYSFSATSSSGMWADPSDVNISVGGTNVLQVNASGFNLVSGYNIYGVDGIQANGGDPFALIDGSSNQQITIGASTNIVEINNKLQVDGQLLASNGSGANPSISFQNDNTSGLYLITPTSDMRLDVGGTDIIQITPSATNIVNGSLGLLGGDLNMNGHSIHIGGANIDGLQTITAQTGVNLNIIDGSSNQQLQIPATGNVVNITNSLNVPAITGVSTINGSPYPPSPTIVTANLITPAWTSGIGPFNVLTITPTTSNFYFTVTINFVGNGGLFLFGLNSSVSGNFSQNYLFAPSNGTAYVMTLAWNFSGETIGSPTTISLNSHSGGNPFNSVSFATAFCQCY
jgi:hypothetical protein